MERRVLLAPVSNVGLNLKPPIETGMEGVRYPSYLKEMAPRETPPSSLSILNEAFSAAKKSLMSVITIMPCSTSIFTFKPLLMKLNPIMASTPYDSRTAEAWKEDLGATNIG